MAATEPAEAAGSPLLPLGGEGVGKVDGRGVALPFAICLQPASPGRFLAAPQVFAVIHSTAASRNSARTSGSLRPDFAGTSKE